MEISFNYYIIQHHTGITSNPVAQKQTSAILHGTGSDVSHRSGVSHLGSAAHRQHNISSRYPQNVWAGLNAIPNIRSSAPPPPPPPPPIGGGAYQAAQEPLVVWGGGGASPKIRPALVPWGSHLVPRGPPTTSGRMFTQKDTAKTSHS